MRLQTAIRSLSKFNDWTDQEKITALVKTMDRLNNGDALEYLDHWISHARASVVVNCRTPLEQKNSNR